MILEGLTTTREADGSINVAPLGPIVGSDFRTLTFRPFPGSRSYDNLQRTRCGVFHVVDDVLLLVQTALDLPHGPLEFRPATAVEGAVLWDCCRWYEFVVRSIDESGDRPVMAADVVYHARLRDSFGFNRAKHAVIEAVIAATRLQFLTSEQIAAELQRARVPVQKTGGETERRALQLVQSFVREHSPATAALLSCDQF
ncbi:MAG: DUF447 domain-containing protein [Planctomycetaceae bacterium]